MNRVPTSCRLDAQFSHSLNSLPSGGFISTFFAFTSFQFVLNTVPPSKWMRENQ